MTTRTSCLIAFAILTAACGSGTVRPTDEPSAVAPAPSPAPSTPVVDPDPAPAPTPGPPDSPPDAERDTTPEPSAAAPSAPAGQSSDLEIRRIGRWVSSGIKGNRRLVIRDSNTWASFWSELGAGVRPKVDFSRDLVIAVASGERTSGGHDLAVDRVSLEGGDLRIEVVETSPGPNCMTTAAMTQPVDVVMVPGAGVNGWSFIDRKVTRGC